jgi:hypothetical protein
LVRQRVLIPSFVGSSPATPAKFRTPVYPAFFAF